MINVSKLKKGIVLDHIEVGQGFKVFQQLKLDRLSDVVVLMRNVDSTRMGKKDLIKIETDLELDLNVLGLLNPGTTVTYVKDGKAVRKLKLELPERVEGILSCKNPRCISSTENVGPVHFTLANRERKEYSCEYCEARARL
ncbi:MAG: aspartate carbamoyltransferase regulatory subunit [Christensenellaceae bacterium]|jgi:aspartate carbamoyltransferase regulatory subunit|nr:aspartate carbamoyltransferase regulatory subunit [Christensenellaceae bacterium]